MTAVGLERTDIALIHDVDGWTHGDRQREVFASALDGAYRAAGQLKNLRREEKQLPMSDVIAWLLR